MSPFPLLTTSGRGCIFLSDAKKRTKGGPFSGVGENYLKGGDEDEVGSGGGEGESEGVEGFGCARVICSSCPVVPAPLERSL